MNITLQHFPQRSDFLVHLHLHSGLRRIQWATVKCSHQNVSFFDFVNFRPINDKNNVGVFKILPICLPTRKCLLIWFWSSLEVDRIYLAVNLALPLFINDMKTSVNIRNRQHQTNRSFRFVLPCIAYWFRCGLTRAYRIACRHRRRYTVRNHRRGQPKSPTEAQEDCQLWLGGKGWRCSWPFCIRVLKEFTGNHMKSQATR